MHALTCLLQIFSEEVNAFHNTQKQFIIGIIGASASSQRYVDSIKFLTIYSY